LGAVANCTAKPLFDQALAFDLGKSTEVSRRQTTRDNAVMPFRVPMPEKKKARRPFPGSLAVSLAITETHSFPSPPRDGFGFLQDVSILTMESNNCQEKKQKYFIYCEIIN
jgi:hypothetical protein